MPIVFFSGGNPPTGQIAHGASLTIQGTGFGTKSRGFAPLLRDYGQDGPGNVNAGYASPVSPFAPAPFANNDLMNRAIGFNPNNLAAPAIGAPHPFVQCILAGCHYNGQVNNVNGCGWQAGVLLPTFTGAMVVYAHHYKRADPGWSFTPGDSDNDQNYKAEATDSIIGIGGTCTYIGPDLPSPPSSLDNTVVEKQYSLSSNATNPFESPDRLGHTNSHQGVFCHSGYEYYNPNNGWICQDMEMCLDQTTGPSGQGYVDVWQSNQNNIVLNPISLNDYAGRTDGATGTTRFFTFGGGTFVRDCGPGFTNNTGAQANWDYAADLYCDATLAGIAGGGTQVHVARVVATDNAVYTSSTLRSPCVIQSWSNTSITCTFWKDRFVSGQKVYFHVITEINGILQNQFNGTVA